MLALTTVVAIAVTCSVVFMVSAVVITIAWVKIRQERVSLALVKSTPGPYGRHHGLQNYPAETLTELSREEGSALRQYGQLPYGRPTEWGLLTSREDLIQHAGDKEIFTPLPEKMPTLPILPPKSCKSKRQSKTAVGMRHPSYLTTLTEASEGSPKVSYLKEEISLSAVDGVLELPTETTPRQTPEREDEQPKADTTMRPISGAWPMTHRRDRSGNLFPVFEEHYEVFDPATSRVRGGSITSQTAGAMPEQPVPPPPCAYPPNRFRLSKNDSMRFSSLSLETADSSILDESRRTSTNIDVTLASPALPPCPKFVPFSANDVGRMEYDRNSFASANSAIPGQFTFPATSPTYEGQQLESERGSPRRSLTARSPTHSTERVSPPPRRSESMYTKQTRGDSASSVPYLDLNRIPPLNTVGRNTALLPHFSQMQRHSMHGSPRRKNDPFSGATTPSGNLTYNPNGPGRRASSYYWQDAALHPSNGHLRSPLPSALKGGSGPRKGHRRQNCVRISIHPPITFGGPSFSPMVEEPEEPEDFDMRRSQISDLSTSNISRNSSVSAMSTSRNSLQEFQRERPFSRIIEVSDESPSGQVRSPSKKKKHMHSDYGNGNPGPEKTLPEIFTSIPTTVDQATLSHTPSPEKNPPVWVSDYSGSPTRYENSPAPGSPRRSGVMGPRTQPGRPARNSYQSLVPQEDDPKCTGSPERPPRAHSIKAPSGKPVDSLRRAKSEAREPTMPEIQSQAPQESNLPAQNGIIVPIWEDKVSRQPAGKSTVSLVNEPAELQGDVSPQAIERSRSSKQANRMSSMSSYRKPRQAFTTPTKKAVGLGIGAATPGSLYDGDGFLKE